MNSATLTAAPSLWRRPFPGAQPPLCLRIRKPPAAQPLQAPAAVIATSCHSPLLLPAPSENAKTARTPLPGGIQNP